MAPKALLECIPLCKKKKVRLTVKNNFPQNKAQGRGFKATSQVTCFCVSTLTERTETSCIIQDNLALKEYPNNLNLF